MDAPSLLSAIATLAVVLLLSSGNSASNVLYKYKLTALGVTHMLTSKDKLTSKQKAAMKVGSP